MIDAVLDRTGFTDDFNWVREVFAELFSGVSDTLGDVYFCESLGGGAVFPGDAGVDFFFKETRDLARGV